MVPELVMPEHGEDAAIRGSAKFQAGGDVGEALGWVWRGWGFLCWAEVVALET